MALRRRHSRPQRGRAACVNDEFPQKLRDLLHNLRGLDHNDLFQRPAVNDLQTDEEKLQYLCDIEHPMDFEAINEKVQSNKYVSLMDFAADCALVWDNALRYNAPGSFVHNKAVALRRDAKHNIDAFRRKFPSVAAAVRCPTCQRMHSRESFDDHIDSCALQSVGVRRDPECHRGSCGEGTGADVTTTSARGEAQSHRASRKILSAESPEMAEMRRVTLPHRTTSPTSPANNRLGITTPTSRPRGRPTGQPIEADAARLAPSTHRDEFEVVDLCDESQTACATSPKRLRNTNSNTNSSSSNTSDKDGIVVPPRIYRSVSETATAGSLTQSLSDTDSEDGEQLHTRIQHAPPLPVLETQQQQQQQQQQVLESAVAKSSYEQPPPPPRNCPGRGLAAMTEQGFQQASPHAPSLHDVLNSPQMMSPSMPIGSTAPLSPDPDPDHDPAAAAAASSQFTATSQMSPSIDLNSQRSQPRPRSSSSSLGLGPRVLSTAKHEPHAGRSRQPEFRDTVRSSGGALAATCSSALQADAMHPLSQSSSQEAFLEPTQLGSQSPQFPEEKTVLSPPSGRGSESDGDDNTVLCKETQMMPSRGVDSSAAADDDEAACPPEQSPVRRARGLKLTAQNLARVQGGSFGLQRPSTMDNGHGNSSWNDGKSFGSRSSSGDGSRTSSVSSQSGNASLQVGIGFHSKQTSGSESSDDSRSNHYSRQRRKARQRQQQRRRDRQRKNIFRKPHTAGGGGGGGGVRVSSRGHSGSSSDSDDSCEPQASGGRQILGYSRRRQKLDRARPQRQLSLDVQTSKPARRPSRRTPPKKCVRRTTADVATQEPQTPSDKQGSQASNDSTGWMCVDSQSSARQTPYNAQPNAPRTGSQQNRRGRVRASGGGRQLSLRSFLSATSAGSTSQPPSRRPGVGSTRNRASQHKLSASATTCSFIDDSADESESDGSLYEPPRRVKKQSAGWKAKVGSTARQRQRGKRAQTNALVTRNANEQRRTHAPTKRLRRDAEDRSSAKKKNNNKKNNKSGVPVKTAVLTREGVASKRFEDSGVRSGDVKSKSRSAVPKKATVNSDFVPETQDPDVLFPSSTKNSDRQPRRLGFAKGLSPLSTLGSDVGRRASVDSEESAISSSSGSDFDEVELGSSSSSRNNNRSTGPARLQDAESPPQFVEAAAGARVGIRGSRAAQLLRENAPAFRTVTRVARRSHADDCEISTQEQMRQGRYLDLNGLPAGAEVEEIQSTLMVSQWDDNDEDDDGN